MTPGDATLGQASPDGGDEQDRRLLAAHLAGDPAAFPDLVRRYRDRLWAVAVRTCADRQDAEDALQEALISAFRRAGSYRGEAKVTTWLHRIVVNACLDRLRRIQSHRTVPLTEDDRRDPHETVDPLERRETVLEIEAALAALPLDQRCAVVLVDLEGWPVEDAARILDVPAGTVKSRCSRGRARLALSLGHLRNPTRPPGVPSGPEASPSPGSDPEPPREGGTP